MEAIGRAVSVGAGLFWEAFWHLPLKTFFRREQLDDGPDPHRTHHRPGYVTHTKERCSRRYVRTAAYFAPALRGLALRDLLRPLELLPSLLQRTFRSSAIAFSRPSDFAISEYFAR